NGFQILLEIGLLPGIMIKNKSLKFVCKDVFLGVENNKSIFTKSITKKVLKIPVAHGEGNYFTDEETLKELEANNQILFRYVSSNGKADKKFNPNGSLKNIAGIMNKKKNIMGLMPHPERCCDPLLGNTDGAMIFRSVVENFSRT
ncbi:MAG: phosphoribosylformylglycinamidine synthase I, partial [Bacteroidota bacterium]